MINQDAEWDPWKFEWPFVDEEMVRFAADAEFTYYWSLEWKRVVRKDHEGNCSILINRK